MSVTSLPTMPSPHKPAGPAQCRQCRRGWRLWIARLVALVAGPSLLIGGLELTLRVANWGYPASFFIREPGRGDLVTNPKFGWQFFPLAVATTPAPQRIAATKPPGACRIVLLGDSAPYGTPRSAYGFGRMLEVLLRQQHPGASLDVINACLPSITSHGLLKIARDSLDLQPDLFVVFVGNNEVVGPYGVGTVFKEHSPNLRLIRAAIGLRATRTGQFLLWLTPGGGWGVTDDQLRGVQNRMALFLEHQVPAQDPRLETVYSHYRANLADLCRLAGDHGVRVLLCTVPVNLRDWRPFASLHRQDLPPLEHQRWQALYDQGLAAQKDQRWEHAIDQFTQAAGIDDQYADLHYQLALCLAASGRDAEAAEQFQLACDLDTVRFRSATRTNQIIRQVAVESDPNVVRLLDTARIFADASPQGSPGREMFYEHVHFRPEGNYLLARSALDALHDLLPGPIRQARATAAPAGLAEVADLLALTAWDQFGMEQTIFSGALDPTRDPPGGSADSVRQALTRMQEQVMRPESLQRDQQLYQRAIAAHPDDPLLRMQFAKFLLALGRPDQAEPQLLKLVELTPNFWQFHAQLAEVAAAQGHHDQALAHLRRAADINPSDGQLRARVEQMTLVAEGDGR